MASKPFKLDRLTREPITDKATGGPTQAFQWQWQKLCQSTEDQINGILEARAAAAAAQTTADTAITVAESKQDGSPVLNEFSDLSGDGVVRFNLDGTFDSVPTGTSSGTDILTRADGDGRYALAAAAGVSSFNTRTGAITLLSADVTGALGYTPTSVTGLTGSQSVAAFKTGLSLVKADVGLGSVDNTADAAKNVLTATKLVTARTIAMTGDVAWSVSFDGSGNATAAGTIQAGAVTLAKMADVATATVFYRKTAGTGAPEVQTLATLKTDLGLSGTNTGDQTSVSGNAGTATALQTPRNIAGHAFDGTAAISIFDTDLSGAAYSSWTPTWTNLTVGNGTVTAVYKQVGKTVRGRIAIVFGSTTSISGDVSFDLPVTRAAMAGTNNVSPLGCARFYDAGVAGYEGAVHNASTSTASIRVWAASGAYVTAALLSSTVPFTWGTSDEISAEFEYEAA